MSFLAHDRPNLSIDYPRMLLYLPPTPYTFQGMGGRVIVKVRTPYLLARQPGIQSPFSVNSMLISIAGKRSGRYVARISAVLIGGNGGAFLSSFATTPMQTLVFFPDAQDFTITGGNSKHVQGGSK